MLSCDGNAIHATMYTCLCMYEHAILSVFMRITGSVFNFIRQHDDEFKHSLNGSKVYVLRVFFISPTTYSSDRPPSYAHYIEIDRDDVRIATYRVLRLGYAFPTSGPHQKLLCRTNWLVVGGHASEKVYHILCWSNPLNHFGCVLCYLIYTLLRKRSTYLINLYPSLFLSLEHSRRRRRRCRHCLL